MQIIWLDQKQTGYKLFGRIRSRQDTNCLTGSEAGRIQIIWPDQKQTGYKLFGRIRSRQDTNCLAGSEAGRIQIIWLDQGQAEFKIFSRIRGRQTPIYLAGSETGHLIWSRQATNYLAGPISDCRFVQKNCKIFFNIKRILSLLSQFCNASLYILLWYI